MKYKDFKNTETYLFADVLEVYLKGSIFEFDFDYPEEKLDEMEVVSILSDDSGYVSVELSEV